MKVLLWGSVIGLSLLLQATILPLAAYKSIRPDLLLIVVVSSGLLLGKEYGVSVGFFSGLLQDLASGNIFGLNTLSKLAVGYLCGMVERQVFKEHIFLPVMAMSIATLLNSAMTFAVLLILGYKVELGSAVVNSVLPLLFYNVLFSIPVHQVIYRMSQMK